MSNTFKYVSTIASILIVIFVQMFLSPYRSELEALGVNVRDDNAILVAITFLSIAIFLMLLNVILDRIGETFIGAEYFAGNVLYYPYDTLE